jgi:hypothetical protein
MKPDDDQKRNIAMRSVCFQQIATVAAVTSDD